MQRLSLPPLAAIAYALGAASAFAQQGDLSGVTLRVLDDVSDVDAVILDLDANRGEGEDGEGADEADSTDPNAADAAAAEDGRSAEAREREALHDPAVDERSEGKLEDNDVEQPAPAPTP